jgi:hypothetical protein
MMMVVVVSGKCRHGYGQQHKSGHEGDHRFLQAVLQRTLLGTFTLFF